MKIAAKESEETKFWLLLCNRSKNYPNLEDLILKLEIIQKVINKIIATLKRTSL